VFTDLKVLSVPFGGHFNRVLVKVAEPGVSRLQKPFMPFVAS